MYAKKQRNESYPNITPLDLALAFLQGSVTNELERLAARSGVSKPYLAARLAELLHSDESGQRIWNSDAVSSVPQSKTAKRTKRLPKTKVDSNPRKPVRKRRCISPEGLAAIKAAQVKRWKQIKNEKRMQRGLPPKVSKAKKSVSGIKAYWQAMTPEQRKQEMARRAAKKVA